MIQRINRSSLLEMQGEPTLLEVQGESKGPHGSMINRSIFFALLFRGQLIKVIAKTSAYSYAQIGEQVFAVRHEVLQRMLEGHS